MVEKKTTKTAKTAKPAKPRAPKAAKAPVSKASVSERREKKKAEAIKPEAVAELVHAKKTHPAGRYIFAVGRRKTSRALVKLYDGAGNVTVNGKSYKEYFAWPPWQKSVMQPLTAVGMEKSFDVVVKTLGGGTHSQADAIAHGIARALVEKEATYRKVLKTQGLLTRDPRMKE